MIEYEYAEIRKETGGADFFVPGLATKSIVRLATKVAIGITAQTALTFLVSAARSGGIGCDFCYS